MDEDLLSATEVLSAALNNSGVFNFLYESSHVKLMFDNGQHIYVDSILLIIYSNVFRLKFNAEWKHQTNVELKGECYEAYLMLVTYIYTGQAELDKLSLEHLVALVNLAFAVDARPDLIDECAHQLTKLLPGTNCIDIFGAVHKLKHGCDDDDGVEHCIHLYDSIRRLEKDTDIVLKDITNLVLNFIGQNFCRVMLTADYIDRSSDYLGEVNHFVSKYLLCAKH